MLVEVLLIRSDFFVQSLTAVSVDGTVCDLEHTLTQEAHDLVVDLEVEAHQA